MNHRPDEISQWYDEMHQGQDDMEQTYVEIRCGRTEMAGKHAEMDYFKKYLIYAGLYKNSEGSLM